MGWPPLWGQVPRAPALTVAEQSPAAGLRQALELYRTASYAEAARGFEHYLKTHPDSLPTRKLLAHCYLRLEQPKLAMRVLRVVIARLPKDVAAHQALRKAEQLLKQQRELEAKKPKPEEIQQWFAQAEGLIEKKKFFQAETLLRQVLQERPELQPVLLRLAEICAGTERFSQAATLYQRLLHLRGKNWNEVELRLARSLAWAEQYPDAIVHFENYLKRHPENLKAHFEVAEVYRWSGSPPEAILHYQIVLEKQSDHTAARMGVALCYQGLDQHAEALKEFDALLQSDPDDQQAREARAHSLAYWQQERKRLALFAQEEGNYEEAIRLLREYEQANPEEIEVVLRLARLCSWSGELEVAREYYEHYLDQQPGDATARLELAEVQNWQGDYRSARQTFLQILEAEAENQRVLLGLIRTYQWSGELEGVEPYLERMERTAPPHTIVAEVRGQLALLRKQKMRARAEQLQEANNYVAAIEAYREYLAACGPESEIELQIPRLYAWNRQYERATEEYQSYSLRYPTHYIARLELAEVQRWNSDYESALRNYSTFLGEDPRNSRALLGRAEALYASRPDLFKVRHAYKQALQANPHDPLAGSRLREINTRLQPQGQVHTYGLFDSDGLNRVVAQPQATFLLPNNYRLITRFRASYTHQRRFLPGGDPDIARLNQRIEELGGTLQGGRAGLRAERHRPWGAWGGEAQLGTFSDDRVSFTFGGDVTIRLSERGQLWSRYEHEEASFELNTLSSLAAGIMSDSGRVRYRHQLPHNFEVSSGYGITYFSDSDRFGFSDNLRHAADVRLTYRRLRAFQPGYSYSATGYRSDSPLYFSPGLYQAHRFEYQVLLGRRHPFQFMANGSFGPGRIDGTTTLEVTLAPELSFRLREVEIDLGYRFGRSRASSFGNPVYRINGFLLRVRFPFPR